MFKREEGAGAIDEREFFAYENSLRSANDGAILHFGHLSIWQSDKLAVRQSSTLAIWQSDVLQSGNPIWQFRNLALRPYSNPAIWLVSLRYVESVRLRSITSASPVQDLTPSQTTDLPFLVFFVAAISPTPILGLLGSTYFLDFLYRNRFSL